MISSNNVKILTPPGERFLTTYGSDFKPLSERKKPIGNQLRARTEPKGAPSFLKPPQSPHETWPVFNHYFYKTTNSTYGSGACPPPPSFAILPAYLAYQYGGLSPSIPEASEMVDTALNLARTPEEVGIDRATAHLPGEQERARLHYVFGGKGNPLEEQQSRDGPQKKIDVVYEEGLIVLSSLGSPTCCEDILRSACREAGLSPSAPILTIKDAGNWDHSSSLRGFKPDIRVNENSYLQADERQGICRPSDAENVDRTGYLRGFRPDYRPNESSFLQPGERLGSCPAWETECTDSCRFRMLMGIPGVSTEPPARPQHTVHCPEPIRKPVMTEYQARYAPQWDQSETQQNSYYNRALGPRQQSLYLPL